MAKTARLGVLTSGGDAQGMNAAVRSAVRAALERKAEVFGIFEGFQGMIEGGNLIRPFSWDSVGGVLQEGGTLLGTARSPDFLRREGRKEAVYNLLLQGINRLIVIGGDGSLTGAQILREEWRSLLEELVAEGRLEPSYLEEFGFLTVAGLVGSIDNDMFGTDLSIGTDSALHRITEALDAITSTAASHQRAFVVEVMGHHCGHLALMGALASGADFALIPESPPNLDEWEERMCSILRTGREMGRRDSIVVVAEGAQDRHGNAISSAYVEEVLTKYLEEEARVTVLGHVQRGGSPSASDRVMATLLGAAAAEAVLNAKSSDEAVLIGFENNKIVHSSLTECVEQTHKVGRCIHECRFDEAMEYRGKAYRDSFRILRTLIRANPRPPPPNKRRLRVAVMTGGAPAPGMNAATRAVVRMLEDNGHIPLGVKWGFRGLIDDDIEEMNWMAVNGWAPTGGSELGSSRKTPEGAELYAAAQVLEKHRVDAIVMIGGWAGYHAAHKLYEERHNFPAFDIPIICIPASINNNLPGSELSIGADTALNSIVEVVDKIKQSAVALNRCFIVEVMGRYCGYLALMSAIATGAERVYLHEEGITLKDLERDIELLRQGFQQGKRLGLMIRNEAANSFYTTSFISALFEEEGGDLFEVRQSILGHLQQGGNPSPFDRILAARLAWEAVRRIEEVASRPEARRFSDVGAVCLGIQEGDVNATPLYRIPRLMDEVHQRPLEQWWMELRPLARMLAQPGPGFFEQSALGQADPS
ncbi:MAG: 6-phosphofructokinase [Caldilineaceae bacterium]|nr:6-phosphofructokinase [Caldilineaceae bacterium]